MNINGDLTLSSYLPNGIEIIKEGLKKAVAKVEGISVKYKGAGTFKINIQAEEYKTAEKNLSKFTESIYDFMKSNKSEAEFIRADE